MISSYNEWSTLKRIIVGDATDANWPVNDPVFSRESEKTTWKETPVPRGPVSDRASLRGTAVGVAGVCRHRSARVGGLYDVAAPIALEQAPGLATARAAQAAEGCAEMVNCLV